MIRGLIVGIFTLEDWFDLIANEVHVSYTGGHDLHNSCPVWPYWHLELYGTTVIVANYEGWSG